MQIVPVILCGGSGTRLWPLSRQDFAKQHAPILDGSSPFQQTLRRLASHDCFGRPIVVAGKQGRFMAVDQAAEAGIDVELLLESEGRDTLPAVAAAAEMLRRRDPSAIMLVLPSDHLIPDVDEFVRSAVAASEAARQGHLVTFGLTPRWPATAYGYIRPAALTTVDAATGGSEGTRRIAAFEEKPDAVRAEVLVNEGCLWNSGMFCFSAETVCAEIAQYEPSVAEIIGRALDTAETDLGATVLGPAFAEAPKISFDYGVMEKTTRAVVLEVGFDWSDIGDWHAVWQLTEKDEKGNVIDGRAMAIDARNNYIRSYGRLVCVLGAENLTVVDTPDAVLVAPMDHTQQVKQLVGHLAAAGHPEATVPARVHRPWGWYQTMDLGDRFRVKRIQVTPGKQLSLQKHHHRAEHWIVVRGTAEVTHDGVVTLVRENESIYLPLGTVHRLSNPGRIPVEIIEVQTGAYLEEDDIVRIEDDFGRI